MGEVEPGALVADHTRAPVTPRLRHQEEVDDPVPTVVGFMTRRSDGYQRQRRANLARQVAAGLIQADDRRSG